MSARIYGSLPLSCLTPEQIQSLFRKSIELEDVVDGSCVAPSLNTCERDAEELLSQYPVYDTARGVYTAWGAIPLTWEFENTPSVEEWGSARYVDGNGYRVGDEVLVISEDGRLVTLYIATANGPVPAGPFNESLWSEVCRIVTSEPVGLPDITELRTRYPYYNPNTSYDENDIVLRDTRCKDFTCAYIAGGEVLMGAAVPPSPPWLKLYCVSNGNPEQCSEQISCGPGRTITDLSSSDTDLVCVPTPFWYQPEPFYDTTPVES